MHKRRLKIIHVRVLKNTDTRFDNMNSIIVSIIVGISINK